MKHWICTAFAFSWVLLGVLPACSAQQTQFVTDASFTATATYTEHGQVTLAERIGRASNGSTFMDFLNPDGTIRQSIIQDVPARRSITIYYGSRKRYHIDENRPWHAYTTSEWSAIFLRAQRTMSSNPPLGTRMESDLMLYERRETHDGLTTTSWESPDLGTPLSYVVTNTQGEVQSEYKLTDMQRNEPDAAHFIIPAGFPSA